MAKRNASIKVVLDKVLRNPLLADVNIETAVDYTLEFIDIVNVPTIYTKKEAELTLEDFRVALPEDWVSTIQIKHQGKILRVASGTFSPDFNDFTFYIDNRVLITSIKEGKVQISYNAVQTDLEGFPMVPEDSPFIIALEWYIKQRHYYILWELGKLPQQVLETTRQEYCWAVGRCQTRMHLKDLSEMEAFSNSWRTLVIRKHEFHKQFRFDNTKEHIYTH